MPTTTYSDPAGSFEPLAIKGRTTAAGAALVDTTVEALRAFIKAVFSEGIVEPVGAFQVLQDTGSNMNVKLGSGAAKTDLAVVYGDDVGQGAYLVRGNDATHTLTVPAAHATLARLDEIYLVVRDTAYDASGIGTVRYGYRQGDASATPAAPGPDAAWDAELLLAQISVPAADTSISNAQIDDLRIPVGFKIMGSSRLTTFPLLEAGGITTQLQGTNTVQMEVIGGSSVTLSADNLAMTGVDTILLDTARLVKMDGTQTGTSSFSGTETVKLTCTLDIPTGWTNWAVVATITGRVNFNGSATTITHRLRLAGSFEQTVGPQSNTVVAVTGFRSLITGTTGVQTFDWLCSGNGTGDLADLAMTVVASQYV